MSELEKAVERPTKERDEARAALAWSQANPSEQQVGDIAARLAALEPLRIAAESFVQGTHNAWAPGTDGAALVAAVDALRGTETRSTTAREGKE